VVIGVISALDEYTSVSRYEVATAERAGAKVYVLPDMFGLKLGCPIVDKAFVAGLNYCVTCTAE
jgi:hypothetical protein